MAPVVAFTDDFESGTLEAWASAEGMQAAATEPYSGAWSAQASTDADASFATAGLPAPVSRGVAQMAFRVHDLTTRATLLKLRGTDGPAITVGLNLRSQPFVFMSEAEAVFNDAGVLPADVWHQLSVEFSTDAGATTRVSVDGVVVKELASAESTGPIDRLSIGTRRAGRVFDLWFDDVSVVDLGSEPEPDPEAPLVAAAGDIACDPASPNFNGGAGTAAGCRMAATADLLTGADLVLPLGDIQYEGGARELYDASYGPTWGRFLAISRPVVGNHEYEQPGASAYFSYFGAMAGPPGEGWYSYDIGTWHVVALNSECAVVGCGPGSAQYEWLRADLEADDAACTLAYWHRPSFSSGHHGGDAAMAAMWRLLDADGAELVLSGHDHHYERFAPQDADGVPSAAGIRQFVVGTGGKSVNALEGAASPNSQVRNDDTFGVLQLRLDVAAYDWRFAPVTGSSFSDAGSAACR
jgi:hypothetical protein